jgi:hypothetical protein
MPAFWPTRSPTGEVAKVGFGSKGALQAGTKRLIWTTKAVHLSNLPLATAPRARLAVCGFRGKSPANPR